MLSLVSWQCDCGMNVKAMYNTDGITKVRCPNTFCKMIHIVEGKITELWIKDDSANWRPYDFAGLIAIDR